MKGVEALGRESSVFPLSLWRLCCVARCAVASEPAAADNSSLQYYFVTSLAPGQTVVNRSVFAPEPDSSSTA